MDPSKLSKALDNIQNEIFLKLTTKKIKLQNYKIIHNLGFTKDVLRTYMEKLNGYRYVDEINQLKRGNYIRWIHLVNHDNLVLERGGAICDIKITDTCTLVNCRNNYGTSFFHIKMDECLIFQKLSNEEQIILSAMDYLE